MKITLSDIAIGALVGTILVTGGAVGIAGYYAMNPDRLAAQAEPNPIVASTEIAEPIPVPDTPVEAIAGDAPAEQTLPSESFWNSGAYVEEAVAETPSVTKAATIDTAQTLPLGDTETVLGEQADVQTLDDILPQYVDGSGLDASVTTEISRNNQSAPEDGGTGQLEALSSTTEYIGNSSTMKFHRPTCRDIAKMDDVNKVTLYSRDEAINSGYSPCGHCHP